MEKIHINIKYQIDYDIIMLAADKAVENGISIKLTDNKLVKNDRKFMGNKIFDIGWESSHLAYRPQHLYMLSSTEVKEGDWVLYGDSIMQVKSSYDNDMSGDDIWLGDSLNGCATNKDNCKKVVATTDNSLAIRCEKNYNCNKQLAAIPQSIIENYINKYNEGIAVTKVSIETKRLIKLQ